MLPVRPESYQLVEILADMVRSALAWEEEHGGPPENETATEKAVDWMPSTYTLRGPRDNPKNGVQQHDADNADNH